MAAIAASLAAPLAVSLARIVAAAPAGADWWLIGSVAAKLSGINVEPQDVDVLASTATIEAIADNLGGGVSQGNRNERFRSRPFCRVTVEHGLDIELMGDLEVCRSGIWQPLVVTSRVAVEIAAGTVYVPLLGEQVRIFELFGRPKDLAKAELIKSHLP